MKKVILPIADPNYCCKVTYQGTKSLTSIPKDKLKKLFTANLLTLRILVRRLQKESRKRKYLKKSIFFWFKNSCLGFALMNFGLGSQLPTYSPSNTVNSTAYTFWMQSKVTTFTRILGQYPKP